MQCESAVCCSTITVVQIDSVAQLCDVEDVIVLQNCFLMSSECSFCNNFATYVRVMERNVAESL